MNTKQCNSKTGPSEQHKTLKINLR